MVPGTGTRDGVETALGFTRKQKKLKPKRRGALARDSSHVRCSRAKTEHRPPRRTAPERAPRGRSAFRSLDLEPRLTLDTAHRASFRSASLARASTDRRSLRNRAVAALNASDDDDDNGGDGGDGASDGDGAGGAREADLGGRSVGRHARGRQGGG